jgi:hypothetical protein
MTFHLNLTFICYYLQTQPFLPLFRPLGDYVMSTKMAEGLMTFPLNLSLTYYFETFVIVT